MKDVPALDDQANHIMPDRRSTFRGWPLTRMNLVQPVELGVDS
jgi:hypothetical protein